jgi:ACT domain-containing protein
MALPASDDFNRADGAPGSNWTGSVGSDLTIVSNEVTGAGASVNCSMYWSADTPGASQEAQATIAQTGVGEFAGPLVRANATDWVCGDANGATNWQIEWYNAGAFTVIASWSTAPADGDVAKITASGSAFELFVNATSRASGSNGSAPASGNGGIYVFGNGANSRVDDFSIDNGAWDGYANIEAGASTNGTSLSGGVALNMPSGIVAGHLLIAIASNDNTGGTNMGISGWTQLFHTQYAGNVVSHGVWAKIAAGSDTATLTGASQDYAARVLRITDHGVVTISTDIKVGTPATGSSSTPTPPSLDAGSSKKWLEIATNGSDDDDNTTPYEPTNYTAEAQVESAQSTSSTMIQVAWRKVETQTEDPGTFALAATEEWIANVIAIPPASSGITVTVNQVTETDLAQPIARIKQRAIAQVSETDLAQAIARQKIFAVAQVNESDSAQAIARIKQKLIAQVFEIDEAQPVTVPQINVPVNQVTESDVAQALTSRKVKVVGQALETDIAQAIARIKLILVGQVTETDMAQAITSRKSKVVGQVTETDFAQAISKLKSRLLGQVLESDVAQALTSRKVKGIAQVNETDSAQAILRQKIRAVAQVIETDIAQAISKLKTRLLGQVSETDLAQPVTRLAGNVIQQVEETDLAQALTSRKVKVVGQVSETDIAQALAKVKQILVAQVSETDTAQGITSRKVLVVAQALEADLAQALFRQKRVMVLQVFETDLAFSITPSGQIVLGLAQLSTRLVEVVGLTVSTPWTADLSDHVREVATLEDAPL